MSPSTNMKETITPIDSAAPDSVVRLDRRECEIVVVAPHLRWPYERRRRAATILAVRAVSKWQGHGPCNVKSQAV